MSAPHRLPARPDATFDTIVRDYAPQTHATLRGLAKTGQNAAHAAVALAAYAPTNDDEPQTVLDDLLADLLHLADVLALDAEKSWDTARGHHAAEITGEDQPDDGR